MHQYFKTQGCKHVPLIIQFLNLLSSGFDACRLQILGLQPFVKTFVPSQKQSTSLYQSRNFQLPLTFWPLKPKFQCDPTKSS